MSEHRKPEPRPEHRGGTRVLVAVGAVLLVTSRAVFAVASLVTTAAAQPDQRAVTDRQAPAQQAPAAQTGGVTVTIHGTPEMAGQLATVRVNGQAIATPFNSQGVAVLVLPVPPRTQLSLSVRAVGFQQWGGSVTLNGSEHVNWQLDSVGSSGVFSQWPFVEWATTKDTLQALLNGQNIGKTRKGKGVAPNQKHALGWRRVGDQAVVCSDTVTLQPNEERIYVCNPATGKVTAR